MTTTERQVQDMITASVRQSFAEQGGAPVMPRSQLTRVVRLAERDARQDAYSGRYLPDSRHFTSTEARQAYADVYVVAFGRPWIGANHDSSTGPQHPTIASTANASARSSMASPPCPAHHGPRSSLGTPATTR